MKPVSSPALSLTLYLLVGSFHQCYGQGPGPGVCQSLDTCMDCLTYAFCGSWYNGGGGCQAGCVVSDSGPCYTLGPSITSPETAAQVCARADGPTNPPPTNPPPTNPPPTVQVQGDDFKLVRLSKDSTFCVGIAGGEPMPGQILKLAECDGDDDNMLWKMDGKGRFRAKEQYNDMNLCWHIKAWADGTSIKLKDCTTSGKQKFRDLSDSRQSTGPIVPRRDPNLCLTYAGDSPEKGSKLKLMGCSGRSEQDWSY